MKKMILVSAIVLAAFGNTAFAGGSGFQLTCSNIKFRYSERGPAIDATCLRADGTPNRTMLVLDGISNQNGQLQYTGGPGTFQQSCGSIRFEVRMDGVRLAAFCRTADGNFRPASLELEGIGNYNGNLGYDRH